MTSYNKENVRKTLQKLIENSNANCKAEDVIDMFLQPKDKYLNVKLLTTLKVISKHESHSKIHLVEIAKLLESERKRPYDALVHFLNYYSDNPIVENNSILNTSPTTFGVTKDIAEIKERVLSAINGSINKSSRSSAVGSKNSSFEVLTSKVSEKKNVPSWNLIEADFSCTKTLSIAALPVSKQEEALIYDLIYCLSGMPGNFIKIEAIETNKKTYRYKVSEQIQLPLRNIAYQILDLGLCYLSIDDFIKQSLTTNCGQIIQAFAAGLQNLMDDYYQFLVRLESEYFSAKLNIYKMLYYISPTLEKMQVLAQTVEEINKIEYRDGRILTFLLDKIDNLTGTEEPQELLIHLTELASIPYMQTLQTWIQKGVIDDPQHEFLVEDNELIRKEHVLEHYSADYWEKRYTVRRERIPRFLEKYDGIILRAGKYLNVIQKCGKKFTPQKPGLLSFSPKNENHIGIIENSYRFASKTLLDVLIKENDLHGHLLSVKKYFLMFQGDFITQFMDTCEEELSKNIDKVLPMKLENLLGLTLRLSSARHDPYKEDLHCELLTYDLATQMLKIIDKQEESWEADECIDLCGLECFAFRYDVKWPISLILNHIAISKYQMLFRQLLYCKHVERQLSKVWMENNVAKKFPPQEAQLYRPAFILRQRMMNAIQNLEYYMMIEVIEPNWHIFIQNMKKVENVDDVLAVHQDFLDLCLKNCMLTDPTLLRSLIKLCNICLNFCDFMQKSQRYVQDAEIIIVPDDSVDSYNFEPEMYKHYWAKSGTCFDSNDINSDVSESSLAPNETFSERVKRFDLEFTGFLISLLKQVSEVASENPSDCFINLVYRINFNSYYNEHIDKLCARYSMD